MNTVQIIELLCTNTDQRSDSKRLVKQEAAVSDIIVALRTTQDGSVRQILCDILGELHASEAVSTLLICLDDVDARVRSAAADALAKIGDIKAGPELLEHYLHVEKEAAVKRMLAAAIGAVKYRPAIPVLMGDLSDVDGSLRGTAAWSLGNLGAVEAYEALNSAIEVETLSYARERMLEAIAIIGKHVHK